MTNQVEQPKSPHTRTSITEAHLQTSIEESILRCSLSDQCSAQLRNYAHQRYDLPSSEDPQALGRRACMELKTMPLTAKGWL